MLGTNKKFTAINIPIETHNLLQSTAMAQSKKQDRRITYQEVITEALQLYKTKYGLA